MTAPKIIVKNEPRAWQSLRNFAWSDQRPFVVYVDGKAALDKQGRVRRFESEEGAQKAADKLAAVALN
jgi:hypothetical protein